MKACLLATIDVLGRQYKAYFTDDWHISDQLRCETKSARCHNMDAEEVMGMFSAAKHKATNATVCYLSCKMRAQKNGTVDFLDRLEKTKRDELLMKVVHLGQQQRRRKRKKQIELREELSKRQAKKTAGKRHIRQKEA